MKRDAPHWEERIGEFVIRHIAPAEDAHWLIGDLREALVERRQTVGVRGARRWYRREVMSSLVPLLHRRLTSAHLRRREPAVRGTRWQVLKADGAYAVRLALRSPMASMAVVVTMALGIGVTTSVFGVVNAVLLRPLPFPGADRAVHLTERFNNGTPGALAYPDLRDFADGVNAFAAVTGLARSSRTWQTDVSPVQLSALRTDAAYPTVFGLRPMLGRYFADDELRPGAAPVVILSHGLWQRAFGADTTAVGRTMTLDATPHQIIGVLPSRDFMYPEEVDILVPLRVAPNTMFMNRGAMWIDAVALIRPDVSPERATLELEAVAQRLGRDHASTNSLMTAQMTPLRDVIVGPVRPMLRLLSLAMAAVLLIAAVNVANLLLGRSQARAREFAVRAALGGTRSRLRQQLFSEGLLLSAVGGALAFAIAPALTRMLLALYPYGLPRAEEVGLDLRVVGMALAVTVLAGLLAVWPLVRRLERLDLSTALRQGGRGGLSRAARRRGQVLVIVQFAVSATMLFTAALLVSTFLRLTRVDAGFDNPGNVLTFRLSPPAVRYPDAASYERFHAEVADRLRAMPGVEAVASTSEVPFGGASFSDVFVRSDRGDLGAANPSAQIVAATPGFERALGMRLVRGRSFEVSDVAAAPRVVVIDEELARQAWPGEEPIGRTIDWNRETWTIVGVLGNTLGRALWQAPSPHLYAPTSQRFAGSRYAVVRSRPGGVPALETVRSLVAQVDGGVAITDAALLSERMRDALAAQRFRAWLIGALAMLALVLASLGIYGVVTVTVQQRTREIGIRMALGDTATGVRARVVGEALLVAGIGTLGGLMLSMGTSRVLSAYLYEVSPRDVSLLFMVIACLLGVAIVAALAPARRASRVDPAVALRPD